MIKICDNENCNNEIKNMRSDAKYCSVYCNNNQRHLTKLKIKIKEEPYKKCKSDICDVNIVGLNKGTKYCSKKCFYKQIHKINMEIELSKRPFQKCNYDECENDISKMKKGIKYCCNEHRLLQNKDKNKNSAELWYINNIDKAKVTRKKYYNKNKAKLIEGIKISQKIRRKIPINKLKNSISGSIRRALKKNFLTKDKKTEDILDCDFIEFKLYLESKFEPWMTWDNYGKYNGEFNYGWDMDHIIPLSSVDTEEEILKLNNYRNIQPLCSKINRDIKKDKLL